MWNLLGCVMQPRYALEVQSALRSCRPSVSLQLASPSWLPHRSRTPCSYGHPSRRASPGLGHVPPGSVYRQQMIRSCSSVAQATLYPPGSGCESDNRDGRGSLSVTRRPRTGRAGFWLLFSWRAPHGGRNERSSSRWRDRRTVEPLRLRLPGVMDTDLRSPTRTSLRQGIAGIPALPTSLTWIRHNRCP